MKVSELRIGNLFFDEDNTPCYYAGSWERLDGWVHRDSAGNNYGDHSMFPIPLTVEILLKVGGKHKGAWVGYFWETEVYGEDLEIVFQLMDGALSIFANDNLIKHDSSPTVHSFQNAVYFLTGKELTIEF